MDTSVVVLYDTQAMLTAKESKEKGRQEIEQNFGDDEQDLEESDQGTSVATLLAAKEEN